MKNGSLPHVHREVRCGAMTALYVKDAATGRLGLWLVPTSRRKLTPHRGVLSGVEIAVTDTWKGPPSWAVESLLQVKLRDEDAVPAFGQGRSMRNSPTTDRMKFTTQEVVKKAGGITVRTHFAHPDGWTARHDLVWRKNATWLESSVTVQNSSAAPITLEFLASFSVSGVTPYARDDAPGQLKLHRFRAVWSMEGRLETRPFEDIQLERSWAGWGVRNERFGDVGSLPVNGFFPFVAVEDTGAGVTWAAQLAHPGSWQMEVYRRDDYAAISGGLADRETGHWMKTLAPGASFTTPVATLACVAGDLYDACAAVIAAQEVPLANLPASERDLPVMFNEWTTSWGHPSHENMVKLAESLRGTGMKYLVMDAGWYKPDGGEWSSAQGDWQPNAKMYPDGIRATADAIRARGMIPGLWFEMEVIGSMSPLWNRTDLMLHRDGRVITVGTRRFLDLRKPEVVEHLAERVIGVLRAGNFGYIKVDYNDNIGIGVDGAESLGEGLRQHLVGVQSFFRKLREELPNLVIENCSSGGHRLEPSMLAITSMSSFSDAHECREIPIIAANLQRLMLPRQSQIWAVLRAKADLRRIVYLLTGGFLGRLCLSGDFHALKPAQRALVDRAVALYTQAVPVIRRGTSRRYGPDVVAYRHAQGWQVVVRCGADAKQVLVVGHTFENPGVKTIRVPLPPGKWRVAGDLHADRRGALVSKGELRWTPAGEWAATAVLLE